MMTLKTFRSLTTAIGANSCIKCSSQLIPKITLKMKKQKIYRYISASKSKLVQKRQIIIVYAAKLSKCNLIKPRKGL